MSGPWVCTKAGTADTAEWSMLDWQTIDTAPKDRWIYVWQADIACRWHTLPGWQLDADGPYTPYAGKWDGARCFVDKCGGRIKGATHWRELFDPPGECPEPHQPDEDTDEIGPGEPVEFELVRRDGKDCILLKHKGQDGVTRTSLLRVL